MNNITISILTLIDQDAQGSFYHFSKVLGVGIDTVKYWTEKLVKEGYVVVEKRGRVKSLTLKGSEYLELSQSMGSDFAARD